MAICWKNQKSLFVDAYISCTEKSKSQLKTIRTNKKFYQDGQIQNKE